MFTNNGEVSVKLLRDTTQGRAYFELLEEVVWRTPILEVRVPVGFKTDFASVPRLFWRIVPPAGPHGAAAVVHDFLYVRQGQWTRGGVDKLFYKCLESLGVPPWKRKLMYIGVRLGGWIGWNRNKKG